MTPLMEVQVDSFRLHFGVREKMLTLVRLGSHIGCLHVEYAFFLPVALRRLLGTQFIHDSPSVHKSNTEQQFLWGEEVKLFLHPPYLSSLTFCMLTGCLNNSRSALDRGVHCISVCTIYQGQTTLQFRGQG